MLDNHSMPEQLPAMNTSCHQLSFNAIKVYKITIFICLHMSDYCLHFQRSPSFKIFFESIVMKHGELISSKHGTRDCTDTKPHPDLFKKFQFTVFAFDCWFISATARHCSPDSCKFTEMRISKTFKEWQEQVQLVLIYYAAVLINGVCPTDLLASKHLHTLVQGSPLEVIQYILESFTFQEKKSDYLQQCKGKDDRYPEAKISFELQEWLTNVHTHA